MVMTIENLLLQLVSVQSDTGTALECNMARKLYELILAEPYFAAHPDHCGLHHSDDILGRPVVWALRMASGAKTVVLMGHYDAVEIDSYGALKPYALNPAELKARMKSTGNFSAAVMADLDDQQWLFGRGTADMKAGLAINLHTLFTQGNDAVNLLFIAVPDEENLSAGALAAVSLYQELQARFGLAYRLCLISEPQFRSPEKAVQLIEGSMGKVLAMIVAKGILAHSAEVLKGLNAGLILAEVIRHLELNSDFISEDQGVVSQPPTVLFFKDLKETYDVSIPEYSVAGFNILFLKSRSPAELMASLEAACRQAVDAVMARYGRAWAVQEKKGGLDPRDQHHFLPLVLTLAELETRLEDTRPDFITQRESLNRRLEEKVRAQEISLHAASSHYMKALLEISGITQPVVLIGIAPPYYPAVSNRWIDKDIEYCLDGLSGLLRDSVGQGTRRLASLCSMTDMSYISCSDPQRERAFLDNLTLPASIYDIPVEAIAALNIPALMIGPAGRDVHQVGERVYLPDVTRHIPALFELIINRV